MINTSDRRLDDFRIAIRYHDNDFYFAFLGILHTIDGACDNARNWRDAGLSTFDKERWAEIINEMMLGMYLLWQNQMCYSCDRESTKKYLTIKPEYVLLNEEVDEYLSKTEWDNGETFVMDRRLQNKERFFTR